MGYPATGYPSMGYPTQGYTMPTQGYTQGYDQGVERQVTVEQVQVPSRL
jgi:hypothetical protein